jgi:hypothetical protein
MFSLRILLVSCVAALCGCTTQLSLPLSLPQPAAPTSFRAVAPEHQFRCEGRAWVNAFHPEEATFPGPLDLCPADETRPLFTREGTLTCPTIDVFDTAFKAMERGWRFVPTEGAPNSGLSRGQVVSAESLGCSVYHDGTALQIRQETRGLAETNLGWTSRSYLRNAPSPPPSQ